MRSSLMLAFSAALAGWMAAPVAARAQEQGIPVMTLRAALRLPPSQLPPVFMKPEPLSALPLQHSPDRRPEPQSRRLREVGLHRPQVTAPLPRHSVAEAGQPEPSSLSDWVFRWRGGSQFLTRRDGGMALREFELRPRMRFWRRQRRVLAARQGSSARSGGLQSE